MNKLITMRTNNSIFIKILFYPTFFKKIAIFEILKILYSFIFKRRIKYD